LKTQFQKAKWYIFSWRYSKSKKIWRKTWRSGRWYLSD